ncbi:MAG: pilus assembly FimT family protein [Roseibacillus sp.]
MILSSSTSLSRERQRGFTLLEMMVTLGLIVLLLTFVFLAYRPDSNSEKMKKAVVQLEALSARGHTMAMLHQKPFWLRFERNRVLLQGAELTSVDTSGLDDEFGSTFVEEEEEANQVQSLIVDYDSFEFPEGLELFVRRWGAAPQAWFHQEKPEDPVIFWNFEQGGLCEPVSFRMEIEKSWTELEMDPLTARVADEASEIYD